MPFKYGMVLLSVVVLYQSGQHSVNSEACISSVMPGIGLGPPVSISEDNVTTWKDCRDLCCKNSICVAWTHLSYTKNCFLRSQLGKRLIESEHQISGITKGSVLAAPRPHKTLRFYVGIESAPKNRARVNMLMCPYCVSCFWQWRMLSGNVYDLPLVDLYILHCAYSCCCCCWWWC